jgi:hypothetical protein
MLRLLFLPALYVAWFRIEEPERTENTCETPTAPELQNHPLADAPRQPELASAQQPMFANRRLWNMPPQRMDSSATKRYEWLLRGQHLSRHRR